MEKEPPLCTSTRPCTTESRRESTPPFCTRMHTLLSTSMFTSVRLHPAGTTSVCVVSAPCGTA